MKYKDLPSGAIFQFSPKPGDRETAIKAEKTAYSLKTGQVIDIHANRNCEKVSPLVGDGYRLGVTKSGALVIYSQAGEGSIVQHEFLIIGHAMIAKDAVRPIVGKMERQEQAELLHIILSKIETNMQKTENLIKVLRDGLFEDFAQIKLT